MRMSIDQILQNLSKQAEQDAADYQRKRPGGISADTLALDAMEMADYRVPGETVEAEALRSCYVLVFQTAVAHLGGAQYIRHSRK